VQEGLKVKQTNPCPNSPGSSLIAGFHAHGDQPLVAATGGGSHAVIEGCSSQEERVQKTKVV
jgi:hypothetical protein